MPSGGPTKAARVTLVFASHLGRGKLPMLVVARGGSCMWVSRPLLSLFRWRADGLLPNYLLGGGDDLVDPRQQVLLQWRAERHRHGGEVEPFRRLLEQAKALVGEDAGDLGGHARGWEALVGHHQPPSLADRIADG